MHPVVVFVDANALHSRAIRDWLLHLRSTSGRGLYSLACSRDVIVEAIHSLRKANPAWPGRQVTELHDAFLESFDIVDDYESDIPYNGTDPHDRHVHAAAIAVQAGFLLTDDKGFQRMDSDDLPYEVIRSDDFLVLVDDSHPHLIASATRAQLEWWGNRGRRADLAQRLEKAGCPEFAKRVDAHIRTQAGSVPRKARRAALGGSQ